uniref:SURF1-like protein n=1 Tax=Caenorhabditis tropicalis TaxID=1561998 RepID=A0A1I7TYH9_9PELO
MPPFNIFIKSGKRIVKFFKCSNQSKKDFESIPTRKSKDEIEWEKYQKFIMETPLLEDPIGNIEFLGTSFQERIVDPYGMIVDRKQKIAEGYKVCVKKSSSVTKGVTGNKHGFVVFLTEGPFFDHPEIGQHVMSNRCGFISLSYALLIIHFVYRYMALFQ